MESSKSIRRSVAASSVALALAIVPAAAYARSVARPHAFASHGAAPRTQGYLGIEFHDLTDDQVAAMHLRVSRGVEVVMVDHDGPAGKAGLRPHDVIVSLNGQLVASAEALRRLIHEAGAGASVMLAVLRDGRSVSVGAQLADRAAVEKQAWAQVATPEPVVVPEDEPAVPSTDTYRSGTTLRGQSFIGSMLHTVPFTGLSVEELTPQLAGFFGTAQGIGLLVQAVQSGSPAAAAGLRAGDVVMRADGAQLKTESDWTKHVRLSKGAPITVVLMREKREVTVTLLPDVRRHSLLEWPRLF